MKGINIEVNSMELLAIEATKSTPEVRYDAAQQQLSILGQSYPENAFKFFEPIFKWLEHYLDQLRSDTVFTFELHLPYINTSSTKCFMMLLDQLEEAHNDGKQVVVKWYYNIDNESELECAEEFKEDLVLPFELISIKE
jgi:hypothetical protein